MNNKNNKLGKILLIKQCSNCGKEIEIRHKNRLKNKHFFCSKKCESEFLQSNSTSKLNCECPICHKRFHLKPSHLKKSKNHYCSIACHSIAKKQYMKGKKNHQYGLKGNKNASWKSDKKITNYGYIKIRALDHPFKDADDMVFEHRLIAEKYLLNDENSIEINGKKYLKKEYVVHHIDRNRKNNDISNLKIMTFQEHVKLHEKDRIKNNKKVDKFDLNNIFLESYNSIKEAAIKNNICPQNISQVCKGKSKTAGGYIWKYKK